MMATANPCAYQSITPARAIEAAFLRVRSLPVTGPGDGRKIGHARLCLLFLCLIAVAMATPAALRAQTFAPVPALDFSMNFGGAAPLSQVITVTSTAANFDFTAVASSSTGGNWLTITPSAYGYGVLTPHSITVNVDPAIASTLAAGKYSGQVLVKATSGTATLTVPVTLVIHPNTATFFDQVAGGLTFTLQTGGQTPPGQALQIRNAGAGTLAWTASTSTADGGAWLSISAAIGTAPSIPTVAINLAKLPGLGLTAGTFTGQVALSTGGDTVTVPVTVIVGDSVFRQINPLNFAKAYAGANPLPQVITAASTGASFTFTASVVNSTGGNWLQITPSAYGYGLATPQAITVSVNPVITLAAGTYSAEIVIASVDGKQTLCVPVTMTVSPTTAAFFDDLAGALQFTMETGGDAPPPQPVQIRNAGAGALSWTATVTTADGGKWLEVSSATGTAPANIAVTVIPANLPTNGLAAGTFVGQVVLQSSTSRVTVPISLVVGAAVFRQAEPLNFTKVFGGANPLPQVVTIASTGANFTFLATTVASTGGSWLQISPSAYGYGIATPHAVTVSVNPAVTLAAGTYASEIVVKSADGTQSLTIPVTLTIEPASANFFDSLPGQMTFSMVTKGGAPPSQALEIRNAGTGTLSWSATASTSDGGAWLSISPSSGTAPSVASVTVLPANLPGGGLVAGTFTGQVVLEAAAGWVTVPVTMIVGDSVFRQTAPLDFSKVYGGANPLPQVVTITSTGASFTIVASAQNANGGSWLQITPSAYGYGIATPLAITVSVNPAVTLAPGTYTAEVIVEAADGTQAMTIPVTLNIHPATATFFDNLPGQLTFSMLTKGTAPPAQALEIRNAGAGALAWSAAVSTSDGGNWLTIAPGSGTAPTAPTVTVNPANLPGAGQVAGTFTGQVVLETAGDRTTVPVTMVVGAAVFSQIQPLDFTKLYGGPNPVPQVVTISSTGATFNVIASAANGNGGSWLRITPSSYGYGLATPQQLVVSVNPAVTLAAGTYTAEVIVKSSAGSPSEVIPVTLTISKATGPFFDDMPGGASFFQKTSGTAPAAQSLPIRNAGAGTLDWTATATTADGGKWLAISAAAGTAPSTLTVSVKPASLPGGGLTPGIFNGQIVLVTLGDRQTIPVSYVVGANVFAPVSALSFTMPFNGSLPGSQTLTIASTGANFNFVGLAASATGGNWLTINPSSYGYGVPTPKAVTISVSPASPLPAGSYVGEVIFTSTAGDQGLVVPVTLTVVGSGATATPTFNPPGGSYTSTQTVTLSDATRGSAIYYTLNGTAPTTSSPVYSVPISVTATETINAIAIAPGFAKSAIGTATYTITAPKAATPSPSQTVAISEATSGATVYYTTDGSTPTTNSKVYTGPLSFSSSMVLKFIAVAPNYAQSAVRTVSVTVQ